MSWNQIIKSQSKELKVFLNGYKQSLEQLNADKTLLLGSHSETTAPENVRNKIQRDQDAWKQEWDLLQGKQAKILRLRHAKEILLFFGQSEH